MTLALLGRTWGRRGELAAVSVSSGLERFRQLEEVFLFGDAGVREPAVIESVWEHRGLLIFKFRGVDSISEAERLEGAEVRVPREQRAALPEGEFYQADLVGCEVIERATGERLGTVTGWQEYGGPALLEVSPPDSEGEPLLIPFARAICTEIDPAGKRIVVELPEGLKELPRR